VATGDLTTLANVEALLKLAAGNDDESLLAELITEASSFAEDWCNRQFALQDYVEIRDGNNNVKMPFQNQPVVSINSLTIDGQSIPFSSSASQPGYFFTPKLLMLRGYRFTRGLGNVEIDLQAGFAEIPASVTRGVNEIVAYCYREGARIGMSSQAIAGETTSYIIRDMPPRAASILANYRRVAPI